ncbi:MAG: hypothetical protein QNK04_02005 [Myxococcota bacterium]|nr:hypothetical protein [Myxococcota bacterium]
MGTHWDFAGDERQMPLPISKARRSAASYVIRLDWYGLRDSLVSGQLLEWSR